MIPIEALKTLTGLVIDVVVDVEALFGDSGGTDKKKEAWAQVLLGAYDVSDALLNFPPNTDKLVKEVLIPQAIIMVVDFFNNQNNRTFDRAKKERILSLIVPQLQAL